MDVKLGSGLLLATMQVGVNLGHVQLPTLWVEHIGKPWNRMYVETVSMPCKVCHRVLVFAEATAPPPEMGPGDKDQRPLHWVEMSKSGDMWMLCKTGA